MHLGLLANITQDPWKPFYHISTKTVDPEIELDAVMEMMIDTEYAPGFHGHAHPVLTIRELFIVEANEANTSINKDWLIRAKRNIGSPEWKSLAHKFYRKDEE